MHGIIRHGLLTLTFVSLLFGPIASARAATPEAVVEQATRGLLAALVEEQASLEHDPARLYRIVERVVLPHVDLQRMARWVLGKYWRKATPDQRQRFVREFQTLLVRTYASALASVDRQAVRYVGSSGSREAVKRLVRIEIERAGGPVTSVSFGMHRSGGRWLLYDVKIEGVSLVSNYRSSFSSMIRKRGIDQLIAYIEGHNRDQRFPS